MHAANVLQERKTRREAAAATDSDEELTALERRRPLSSADAPARRETQRQLLFLRALAFFAQLLLELGRRALRFVERAALRYIALVDRLMGRLVRGRGRRARLLAIIGLQLLALVAPLQLLRMQFGSSGAHSTCVVCVSECVCACASHLYDERAVVTRVAVVVVAAGTGN